MTFLSSPLWLLFLLATLALGVQEPAHPARMFSRSYTLSPWPHLDPVQADLFLVTLGILLIPKLSVSCSVWRARAICRQLGWPFPGLALELCLSALLAPVLMARPIAASIAAILGDNGGWQPQQHGGNGRPSRGHLSSPLAP